jgi:hypothetical protein
MHAPVSWHLQGQVFDKDTNVLSGVSIQVSGTVKVTAFNHVVGTEPERFLLETRTDPAGRFAIDCRAAFFKVVFSKEGYLDTNLDFVVRYDIPYKTNQDLRMFMEANR